MRITALKNKDRGTGKPPARQFWEDFDVKASERKESKIFARPIERLSPVFSKTNFWESTSSNGGL